MKRAGAIAIVLLSVQLSASDRNSCPSGPHPLYSRRAISPNAEIWQVKSPDGKKRLTVRGAIDSKDPNGYRLSFTVGVSGKRLQTQLSGFGAEVSWSADSSAFAVTQTEGGGGIGYGAYVFFVEQSGLKKIDLSPSAKKAFSNPAKCDIAPNVAIVGWLHGSDRILVVAETIPVSACSCMGTFELYEMVLPEGRILQKYNQLEAKRKFWSFLGCELRGADDACTKRARR